MKVETTQSSKVAQKDIKLDATQKVAQKKKETSKEKPAVKKEDMMKTDQPIEHRHEPNKQTFHVGMLLFGCGSEGEHKFSDQPKSRYYQSPLEERKAKLGTNLFEATSLRIALS